MVITHIFSDGFSEYNSSHWRGKVQIEALRRAGTLVHSPYVTRWLNDDPDVRRMCSASDLIIIQRVLVEESLDRCRYWLERNKAIVCDFDDSYGLLKDEPDSGNLAAKFWYRGEVEISNSLWGIKFDKALDRHPLKQFAEGAKIITGFTMPSKILAEDWSWAARCWYVPNYIDSPRYLAQKKPKQKKDKLTIGYGGSLSHIPSYRDSGILEALRRVFQKRDNVEFLFCGDERVYNMLPLPPGRKRYQPYVMWGDWPKILSQFDIGVAPLHARYDSSRSYIKSEEYAIMGIPFVATGCPTYEEWQAKDIGVYVEDGPSTEDDKKRRSEEWEVALLDMIDNYEKHVEKINVQFEMAMEYDVDRNVDKILSVYEDILAHKV